MASAEGIERAIINPRHRNSIGGLLSAASGCMDAVSFLGFNTVFVANMTGNTVILGLGLAGAPNIFIAGLAGAIIGFAAGSFATAQLARRLGSASRERRFCQLLLAELIVQAAIVIALLAAGPHNSLPPTWQVVVVFWMGASLGGQGIAARELGLPGVSTLAITSTIQQAVSDRRLGHIARNPGAMISVVTYFVGALVGGLLIEWHVTFAVILAVAALSVAAAAVWMRRSAA